MELTPLNGIKTHPLTEFAKGELRRIARQPVPCQEINPGVRNRLLREVLVTTVKLPSPFKTIKGKVDHFEITDAGRAVLAQEAAAK